MTTHQGIPMTVRPGASTCWSFALIGPRGWQPRRHRLFVMRSHDCKELAPKSRPDRRHCADVRLRHSRSAALRNAAQDSHRPAHLAVVHQTGRRAGLPGLLHRHRAVLRPPYRVTPGRPRLRPRRRAQQHPPGRLPASQRASLAMLDIAVPAISPHMVPGQACHGASGEASAGGPGGH